MPNATYDPGRTYLVDRTNTSYLFRGNEPLLSDGSFAYGELTQRMGQLVGSQVAGRLIDIPVIDCAGEKSDLVDEFAAYGLDFDTVFPDDPWPPLVKGYDLTKQYGTSVASHPGSIIWYPVQGCTCPDNCDQVENPLFAFDALIMLLNKLLQIPGNVVYYHCEHGHDRTSAISAAYMMEYLKVKLQDALTLPPPNGAKAFSHAWETNYEVLVEWWAKKHGKK